MPLTNPVEEFRAYFTAAAPAGLALGWRQPVWWGRRHGDAAQTVLTPYGITTEPDVNRFTHYGIQIACYHTVPDTAALRALEVQQALTALQDSSTAAAGVTLTSWKAQTLRTDYQGVVDALDETGGFLYKAVTNLHLINLDPR